MTKKNKNIATLGIMALSIVTGFIITNPIEALGNNSSLHATYGLGSGQGRYQSINENDFHTNVGDRFGPFNYQFTSGPDFNQVFGRHTYTSTFERDTSAINIRRDRHAAGKPLPYGIFSSITPTPMVNPSFFQNIQSTNQKQPFVTHNPNIINQQQSAHPWQTGTSQGGGLPPTSIN